MVAALVTEGKAAGATTTVTVIGFGLVAPAAITVALVQVAVLLPTTVVEQFQPVPVGSAAMVRPAGSLLYWVMVPRVLHSPPSRGAKELVPLTPTVKLPE